MAIGQLSIRVLKAVPLLAVLALVIVAPAAIVLAQQKPKPGEPAIVIAAPWDEALQIAALTDAQFLAPGRVKSIAMVSSDNPEFTASLYAAGAWLVLSSDLSNILCKG